MPEELYRYIGKKIRYYREQTELTQAELGKLIGVPTNTVSRWETATYKPTVGVLDKLARSFKIALGALLPANFESDSAAQQALLSATGDLPQEDLEELARYADFIRARRQLGN